ncbi:MAG: hypothetical protein P8011_01600 [Acidihalobacter sp.]|uniref:hypothetical protein n=1 Tax=Acidihalobacter sp. TaxID=1872108 RepID=UPI00307D515E
MSNVEGLRAAPPLRVLDGHGGDRGGGNTVPPGRPVIRLIDGEAPQIGDEILASLRTHGLYVHGDRLVMVLRPKTAPSRGIERPAHAPILHTLDSAGLADLAGRHIRFERFDARRGEWVPRDLSRRYCDAILSRGTWPEIRHLTGVVEAPLVLSSGEIIDGQGYDELSGLYLASEPPVGYTRPTIKPVDEAITWARELLLEVFGSLPFVSEADRAAALAGLLTVLLRRAIPAAPMLAITAPTPGTGKSLLSDALATIGLGRRATVLALGDDDAEADKRLVGVLIAGDPMVVIDNVSRPLASDLLCQILTQDSIRARPLGVSAMLTLPTSTAFIVNGNNLAVVGDLRRRTLLVRLDAGVERPELAPHAGDLLSEVKARRGEILSASLTLVRAYIAAGKPDVGVPVLGGFREWHTMCRAPLIWSGLPDPFAASESLRDADPDLEATRALFAAWTAAYGDRLITANQVVTDAMSMAPRFDSTGAAPSSPDMHAALQGVTAEKITAIRLGRWLRRHQDRLVDGLQLVRGEDDPVARCATWKIRRP